jgi:acyl-CoA thioester hydrolase
MDAYGHVNNATYLTFLEEARDRFVERLLGRVSDTWDFVLARVGIDYLEELTQADGEVGVRCRLASFGRGSIRTSEEIVKADGRVAAVAEAVVVPRDPATGRSRPLTDAERALLQAELDRSAEAGETRAAPPGEGAGPG